MEHSFPQINQSSETVPKCTNSFADTEEQKSITQRAHCSVMVFTDTGYTGILKNRTISWEAEKTEVTTWKLSSIYIASQYGKVIQLLYYMTLHNWAEHAKWL